MVHKATIVAIVLLVIWSIGTLMEWPGWIHGFLTIGMFLLIYGIVKRGGTGAGPGTRPDA